MAYPYLIVLTEEQRTKLRDRVGSGVGHARMLTRARILLKTDRGEGGPGWSDATRPRSPQAIPGASIPNPPDAFDVGEVDAWMVAEPPSISTAALTGTEEARGDRFWPAS